MLARPVTEPDAADLAALTRFERFGFRLARSVNASLKLPSSLYQRHVLGPIFRLIIGRLLRVRGLEHPMALPPGSPFLLVSNHRTFFDFFVLATALYQRGNVARRIYFPVRANFFYQTILGLLLNGVIGAFAMYPPIFRERQKLGFNRFAIDEAARLLATPQAMVGIHPEGTRNKGRDPYALLPSQPGVGRVAIRARVPVIPAFVLGMSNDLFSILRRNWGGGEPIRVLFGAPLALEDLYAEGDHPPVHKKIANRMRDAIAELGEQDRDWSAGSE
jgi:1-acyl-sn-glycerol-3-phosphate acyltransferase